MSVDPSATVRAPGDAGWATLPNLVTLVRLALVAPIFVLIVRHQAPVATVVLLVVFGGSDWVDGFLARTTGAVSAVGTILDPIADRAGLVLITIALVLGGQLPLWIAAVVLVVDLLLGVVYLVRRPRVPPVTRLGKWRTAVLMTGIGLIGFGLLPGLGLLGAIGVVVAGVGAVLHVVTGGEYLVALLSGSRAAGATVQGGPAR